ncbi:MAG: zinc-binding dehydrogenase [Chloroflexi bacterium]|nr:zinc-binding dehydrogenase [Chloroflexota bacterium]
MSDTMRGALHDGEDAVAIHDLPMPDRFLGSALIRVRRSGICGSDLHVMRERTEPETVPSGHEAAGEIVELPPGDSPFKVGDRVALETVGAGRSCGACWYCRTGQYRHCLDKAPDSGGGYAEYITRRPAGLFKLPGSLDWQEGALVEPLAVGVHAVRRGGMRPGETVAVVGSSPIGLATAAAARYMGAGRVIASARHPHQMAAAESMGADEVVSSEPGELEKASRDATGGRGADIVFETVGGEASAPIEQSVAAVRPQGRVVEVGGFRKPLRFDLLALLLNEISLSSVTCYGIVDGRHDYELAIEMLTSGRTRYREIVTHVYPFDDVREAFTVAADKSTGSLKVHLTP